MNVNQRLTRAAIAVTALASLSLVLGLAAVVFGTLLTLKITGAFALLLAVILGSVAHSMLSKINGGDGPGVPGQLEQLLEKTQKVIEQSKRLKADQQTLIASLQQAPVACWMKNADNQFAFVNAAWIQLTGISEQEWLSNQPPTPDDFLTFIQTSDQAALDTGQAYTRKWQHPDQGGFTLYSLPQIQPDGRTAGLTGWLIQSGSEDRRPQETHLLTDPITQLGNYRFATEWLQQAIDLGDEALAVIAVKIQGFSLINHTMGHQAADGLLIEVAKRMALLCDDQTQAARIEKDHFALLLKQVASPEALVDQVSRLAQTLNASYALTNLGMKPVFDFGVAQFVLNADTASALIHAAQQDMKQPKNSDNTALPTPTTH